MKTYTPEALRKNLFDLLNKVATGNEEIEISLNRRTDFDRRIVLVSKDRYNDLKELDFLYETDTLPVVRN
ncbi:prevent-host-death protein [Lacticaseibacillus parahuelsenbergensis]|uniref:Prevent-host-death protein n=1 Tax=Lacticaseibacillus parahuelsenbergensis TaxID=3068305 RepID=A0ABY9L266_9LACO|nr:MULTISPECIES: prevent-host-death protein [Lacticaseibacillus]MDE3283700.1 type II toxin-antitoxin system Phd/YefM family antitoxin [Lacticaseibacillus casei]WLV77811.1 prevent-host-death protein [Lacticaseibacillus sp. NCIMB 15471]